MDKRTALRRAQPRMPTLPRKAPSSSGSSMIAPFSFFLLLHRLWPSCAALLINPSLQITEYRADRVPVPQFRAGIRNFLRAPAKLSAGLERETGAAQSGVYA